MARSRLISKVSVGRRLVRRSGFEWIWPTLVKLNVNRPPPDVILGGFLEDDTLVLWATSGLLTGEVDERSRRGDDGALVANSVFVEEGYGGVTLQMDSIHVESGLGVELEVLAND